MDLIELIPAVASIILIDLVLSGDNAVVIGMAAARLDLHQRRLAILLGGGAAILLRVSLTAIAAFLLQVPYLHLVGGVLLIWIAIRLLREEEEEHVGIKASHRLRDAVFTILLADLIMSTDNVLGVAGASHGNVELLIFGLVLSMAILMFMGSLVAAMVNRFWWLSYLGSGVIAWTGAQLILEEESVRHVVELSSIVEIAICAAVTATSLAFAHWFHRVRAPAT